MRAAVRTRRARDLGVEKDMVMVLFLLSEWMESWDDWKLKIADRKRMW